MAHWRMQKDILVQLFLLLVLFDVGLSARIAQAKTNIAREGGEKVIFLDVDGVLHPSSGPGRGPMSEDDLFGNVAKVAELAVQNDARIVVSSNWRFSQELMTRLRDAFGPQVIIGDDDMLQTNYLTDGPQIPGLPSLSMLHEKRGQAIVAWLLAHGLDPGSSNYVILDDKEPDSLCKGMKPGLEKDQILDHFVQLDHTRGYPFAVGSNNLSSDATARIQRHLRPLRRTRTVQRHLRPLRRNRTDTSKTIMQHTQDGMTPKEMEARMNQLLSSVEASYRKDRA